MAIKKHLARKGTVSDPEAYRSLCGRGSALVWNVETIESRQNFTLKTEEVTCKFCLNLMGAR
jgi:hypothetical protein